MPMKDEQEDRPITLQEFAAAVSVWADRRLEVYSADDNSYNWREWIPRLLDEDYRPLDGSLFGEAVLDYRKKKTVLGP